MDSVTVVQAYAVSGGSSPQNWGYNNPKSRALVVFQAAYPYPSIPVITPMESCSNQCHWCC